MRSTATTNRRPPYRLSAEPLEVRDTPAGNVTATVVGNNLFVVGDGNPAGNQVRSPYTGPGTCS